MALPAAVLPCRRAVDHFSLGDLRLIRRFTRSDQHGSDYEIAARFDATIVSLVPTQLYRMLEADFEPPKSLRLILLGGAAATPELVARCIEQNLPIALTYGLTECASQVATATPEQVRAKPGSVGKPLNGTTVRIVDDEGYDLPPGEYGEIVVSGATVMQGYLGQPPTDGTFHTGDIGYLDADGDLWIVQRRSDLIVSGGENVYPSEVEAVLRQHPAVEDACVVGLPDAEWGQRVVAMVSLRKGRIAQRSRVDHLQPRASWQATSSHAKLSLWTNCRKPPPAKSSAPKYGSKWSRCRGEARLAHRKMPMLINGINYHIETHGTGEPLVLLHGFTGSGASWADQAEVFARQFRVVTVDLLGHGQTESPDNPARYGMVSAADDLITIFDTLELEHVNLLGYSMGGRLSLFTALRFPKRINCLILESASPGLKTAAEREARIAQDEALADRIERAGIVAFSEYWSNLPLFATQPPEIRDRLRTQRLSNNPTGLANSLRGMGTGVQPSLWERLGELEMPTFLICGALDTKFSAINAEMHDLIPNSSLTVIPDAGHITHVEQPERFRSEVLRFLGKTPPNTLK